MLKNLWKRRPILTTLAGLVVLIVVVAIGLGFWLHGRLNDSLPMLTGELKCEALSAQVEIERDDRGVPRILANSAPDAFFAQGFLHAQDRFFQMDLCRRFSAGELSALLGPFAVSLDKTQRTMGHRLMARKMAQGLDAESRPLMEAYVKGVNKGLTTLRDVPPEYLILRQDPAPWLLEDSMLVAFFFFDALSYNEAYEEQLGPMESLLPAALYEFLTPDLTSFDRPLEQEIAKAPSAIPGPEVINLRDGETREEFERDLVRTFDTMGIGSNNWAVASHRSQEGYALLANDPHLRQSMPGAWYRLEMSWPDHRVLGLSAPGAPGILIGENGRVAWGFTNCMADHEDLVIVEVVKDKPWAYTTATGEVDFRFHTEEIEVAHGEPEELKVRKTIWGPVVGKDWLDRPLALKSTAHDSKTHNLNILKMMMAQNLDQALACASSWFGPSQNVLVADQSGEIGLSLSGYLPKRIGFDGRTPRSWADGAIHWQGQVARPQRKNPASGVLFSANNRLFDLETSRQISRVWVPAWRAQRIAELLSREEKLSAQDLASIQLDTRNAQYDRLQKLVAEEINRDAGSQITKAIDLVAAWDGHAKLESIGLHILKIFTQKLREQVFAPLLHDVAKEVDDFFYNWPLKDEPFFALIEQRPIHMLAPKYASWNALFNSVFEDTVKQIEEIDGLQLDATWGNARRTFCDHPLGASIPFFGTDLNASARGLPGDANTVRVQGRAFGASMRMVVSPGKSQKSLFQMPGGQSGHFRSPHYLDHHNDWVHGNSVPFMPGKIAYKLTLLAP